MNKWEFQLDEDADRLELIDKLQGWEVKTPCLCIIKPRKRNRSDAQNALFAVWARQRGKQTGNGEIHERCYLKLHYGVPIMCHHDYFREAWEPYKSLPYEHQFNAMKIIDVTSLMETDEMTMFLNHVELDSYEQGYELSKPRQYDEAMG